MSPWIVYTLEFNIRLSFLFPDIFVQENRL